MSFYYSSFLKECQVYVPKKSLIVIIATNQKSIMAKKTNRNQCNLLLKHEPSLLKCCIISMNNMTLMEIGKDF